MNTAKITGLLLVLVLFIAACSGGGGGETPGTPDPPEPDPEPTVKITASPTDVDQGDVVVLSVSLEHADMSDATLSWTAASGEFSDASATNPVWVAPTESGSVTINLELSVDGFTITDNVDIAVGTDVVGWCEAAGDMNNHADPCVIYTITQLQDIGADEDRLAGYYVLGADIDASETETWNSDAGFAPIGSNVPGSAHASEPFTGTFSGDGYTLRGLTINREGELYAALFSELADGAEVKDLIIEDANLAGDLAAAITIYNDGYISDITIRGGTVESFDGYAAGVAAFNNEDATVKDVYTAGQTVNSNKTKTGNEGPLGGIVGLNEGLIENVLVRDAILMGFRTVGGIASRVGQTGEITRATVLASSVAVENGEVGGIAGTHSGLMSFSAVRDTDVLGGYFAGGVVGVNFGVVKETYIFAPNHSVEGTDAVGGFAGVVEDASSTHPDIRIEDSYSYVGEIIGEDDVGGFVGRLREDAQIIESAAFGNLVEGETGHDLGGFVGFNYDHLGLNVVDSYYLSDPYPSSMGGEPLTQQEITDTQSYSWEFGADKTWWMPEASEAGELHAPDLVNNGRYDDPTEGF